LGTALDTQSVDGIDQWIDFDLTLSLTAALQAATDTLSLALSGISPTTDPDSGNDVSLVAYAGESSNFLGSALQPRLVVHTIPEPHTAAVLCGAVLGLLSMRRQD